MVITHDTLEKLLKVILDNNYLILNRHCKHYEKIKNLNPKLNVNVVSIHIKNNILFYNITFIYNCKVSWVELV